MREKYTRDSFVSHIKHEFPDDQSLRAQDKELLMDIGSSPEILDFRVAQFLWIPLETATEDELEGIELGPLARDVITIS